MKNQKILLPFSVKEFPSKKEEKYNIELEKKKSELREKIKKISEYVLTVEELIKEYKIKNEIIDDGIHGIFILNALKISEGIAAGIADINNKETKDPVEIMKARENFCNLIRDAVYSVYTEKVMKKYENEFRLKYEESYSWWINLERDTEKLKKYFLGHEGRINEFKELEMPNDYESEINEKLELLLKKQEKLSELLNNHIFKNMLQDEIEEQSISLDKEINRQKKFINECKESMPLCVENITKFLHHGYDKKESNQVPLKKDEKLEVVPQQEKTDQNQSGTKNRKIVDDEKWGRAFLRNVILPGKHYFFKPVLNEENTKKLKQYIEDATEKTMKEYENGNYDSKSMCHIM